MGSGAGPPDPRQLLQLNGVRPLPAPSEPTGRPAPASCSQYFTRHPEEAVRGLLLGDLARHQVLDPRMALLSTPAEEVVDPSPEDRSVGTTSQIIRPVLLGIP